MSYETRYHQEICRNLDLFTKRRGRHKIIIWMCLLVSLLLGIALRNRNFWKEFMIPGDSAVTVGAIDDFTDELKLGVPFVTAFENFCVEIIADD